MTVLGKAKISTVASLRPRETPIPLGIPVTPHGL